MLIIERAKYAGADRLWTEWCEPYEANPGQPQTMLLAAGWVRVTTENADGVKRQFAQAEEIKYHTGPRPDRPEYTLALPITAVCKFHDDGSIELIEDTPNDGIVTIGIEQLRELVEVRSLVRQILKLA